MGLQRLRSDIAVPTDISIAAPAADVKKEVAGFSGKWIGKWGDYLDAELVVEQVGNDSAKIVYAWADSAKYGIVPGFWRRDAKISGEPAELKFSSPSTGATFAVKFDDASTVRVTSVSPTVGTTITTFKRAP